jgi:FkbM family methyltransferase
MAVFLLNIRSINYRMRKLIKNILGAFGLQISRIKNEEVTEKSKYSKRLTLHDTKTGKYYLPTDAVEDVVANAIKSDLIFDNEIVDMAAKYIKPNTAVLDIGSNFGQMSILFSEMVGEKGVVHAFDADDWVFEILTKNIKANNKEGKIIPHFGAVYSVDNHILHFPVQDFKKFGSYGSYGIDSNSKIGREVKSFTIDSLNISEPISFMKIDIQGGDLQAMKGAVNTIKANKMPILFEYEYQLEDEYNLCFQDYVDFVRSINYRFLKNINGHNYLVIPE